MAASLLQENLRSLHNCLSGDASQKEQSVGIVADLNQICIQEVTDKDIDFCCSCLFDKEHGLVVFLNKAITNDELQTCKARVLEFLSEFIEKVGKRILPYAVDIKDISVSLFSRDRYAKVKNAAMPVLSRLLELTVGSSLGKDLQIEKLITKFFNELTKTTKHSATVKEKIYILLGIVAEVYPEYMTQYSERLVSIYLGALRTEINSKTRKPELSIISGCLEGLSSTLVNFTESADEGSKNSYEIYKYARNAIDPKAQLTRYEVPRAGLRLFARHASQFSQFIIEDYENLYGKMSHWSHHKNHEMVVLGMRAIEAFLSQISEMLVEKAKGGSKDGTQIFKYFVLQFREIMHNESARAKELSLAIRGYGLLAAPCKSYMKPADVKFMFVEMLTKTEQQFRGWFLGVAVLRACESNEARKRACMCIVETVCSWANIEPDDLDNKLFNLASYLESLASIVRQMDELSETHTLSLEALLVLLLENIPNIHPSKHYACMKAILWVLLAVLPKATTFKQILSGFVFQGLIRTCSHPPVVQTENEGEVTPEDLATKKITYKDFMALWSGMLDAANIKEFAAADYSLETRNQLTDSLYNELLSAILRILNKLDLTSMSADSEVESDVASTSADDILETGLSSADPLLGVQAKRPKDFQIFINICDFCRDLLPVKHYGKFEGWVFTFTHRLILMSSDNPLASGFYKLLSISMKIANKLGYFRNTGPASPNVPVKRELGKQALMDVDPQDRDHEKHTCYLLVTKFSKEVLQRMKQYRDDLLASCLTFILSLPQEVISQQMDKVVPAIQVTLNLGLSYLPLAMVAMDALESWSRSLPNHVMSPFYAQILPCLDSFLKTADQGAEDVNVDSNVNTTKSKSGKGRKKLSVRLIKGKKATSDQSYQSQLSTMKQRIMRYLGQLGGSVNSSLLANADDEISLRAIAWDTMQHLKFDMPFEDMKPTIFLDPFLPHIVELATKSSDRQTKVAACELLHSLLLYCLGRGFQQPGARAGGQDKRASMAGLYLKIFPAMLKLACDVEQVAKQLFEPLTMQMIHWFTGSEQSKSDESAALIDSIYDGMIQQSDTALRDFCAKCLHEYLKWAIKQTTTAKSESNPSNAKVVLKRLYSYALHPSPFKRLGAALAFNNIYTVFREEEALVNAFAFELLVHFVESLAIAHTDEKSLGTQEQCSKSLEHLEKIIHHKAAVLRVPSKARKDLKRWSTVTLDIAVRWLTMQCGRPQTECRHACMKLAYQLCPLIPGIKSTIHFFQACLKGKGADYWVQRFEGGGQAGPDHQGIEGFPRLTDTADVFSLQTTLSWFDCLLAALDCYTWVFGENLLAPKDLFSKKSSVCHVFTSIEYFLKNIAMATIEQVATLFTRTTDVDFFTPKEQDEFNRAKCTVVVRLHGFLTIMLAKYKKESLTVIPAKVWCGELWALMCCCVIRPTSVGFNMGDVDIMKNLPQEMLQTLGVFCKAFQGEMKKHFTKTIAEQGTILSSLPVALDDVSCDQIQLQHTLSGYGQLHSVGLLLPCLPGHSDNTLARQLFDNVYKGIVTKSAGAMTPVTLTPTALSVAKEMLKLSFSIGVPAETVTTCILDQTTIQVGSKESEQFHGDLFFTLFRSSLAEYCVSCIRDVVPQLVRLATTEARRVCGVLTATVDFLTHNRELRKREGTNVLDTILSHWGRLSGWWDKKAASDMQEMAVLLLTKLMLIDSKFATTPSHAAFEPVFSMYQTLLTDNSTTLAFKCRVLELLPFFANVPEPHTAKLKSSLDRLVANNFPLRSAEFPKGSPKYLDYITALDRILSGLQLSGSLMLLSFLISIFCREAQHVHEEEIQAAISKFIKRTARDKQKTALDVPYGIFIKTGGFPAEIRRATLERVCLPMLRLASKSAMMDFYLDHITQIRDFMEAKLSKTEGVLEGQLVTRLCCFQLLEVMYSRLAKDEVVGMTSTINRTFADGKATTGKELTSFVSKMAHDAKCEDIRGETALLELRRQYHCAAYNLMIAFISRTQTELKYYTAFLFEEKENKGQFLWENIVDKDKTYEFPSELTSPMERKKRFVSIHEEVKAGRREDDGGGGDYSPSVHLATQYLADSSLSEDVSQYFSMSGSTHASLSGAVGRRQNSNRPPRNPDEESTDVDAEVEVTVEDDYVELEMDALNLHECMAQMIAVVKHMQRTKVTPDIPPGTANPSMPSWMEKLHGKMSNTRTPYNVKLFIAKLIGNTTEVFQPFACHWFKPMCQLVISGPLSSGTINYYITDLIVTILSWHRTAIPQDSAEEKAMASRLVHFVVKNIFHETRPIFRNNLEMLKTLLECWKDRVEIPYQEIYGQFSLADSKAKDNIVGIQLMGVVLACKFPPYGPVAPVDRERYFTKLANNMGNNHKTVLAPAAEVVGMILLYLAEKEDQRDGSLHYHIDHMMKMLHQARPDTFITCVHRMQKHYPAIADRFMNKLLFMLPNLHGEFRTLCLEVLHTRIDQVESVFLELKSKGILDFLSHRDEATQLISLKIVKSVAAKLKPVEMALLMPLVAAFCNNPSTACRNVMYDILMWVYDNYRDEESEESNRILQQTKESLLKGLGDDDIHCRLQVQNFWSSETRLPVGTLDRLVAMLEAMYSPGTEQQYLSYATNLLLEMTSKSFDYNRQIFEHPLSECKFSDYSVKSSWRQRHAAMTPMFATQSSQSMAMDDGEDGVDGIRATQDVQQFTQTQDAGPFNWLTQSSLDTFADANSVTMDTQSSQSSLLFTVGTADSQGRPKKRLKPGAGFGKQKLTTAKPVAAGIKKDVAEQGNELLRLKRRFLKDQEQTRIYFAKKQSRLTQMREIAQREQKTRRENQVTMYRKYRMGDFPDIQIKYSYIIAPLQALAHRDSTVAKLLFSSIFQAIFDKMEMVKTEREIGETKIQINSSLDNILSLSTQYFPPFIGCVLDILYNLRSQLMVDVANVGGAAIFSKLQPLGIVVLEERLILDEPVDARAAKKGRMETPVSKDVPQWIELARLYKSVEEYDVLLGIFGGKIGTQSITREAVQVEARGDFAQAKKLYENAIQCEDWPDGRPLDAEVDLWDDCRMECLVNLAQWDNLEDVVTSAVDDSAQPNLQKVWEDTFYQEHFLPYIIQSKVKLMLLGDENQQSLLDFVDSSMKQPEYKLILENRYSSELALMYLWQEDYDRARHYTGLALDSFQQEWGSTDSLLASSRTNTLRKLQPLIELQEFLAFISEEDNFSSIQPAQTLVRNWNKRTPHVLTDPVGVWDDVVTNRYVYLDQMSTMLHKHEQNFDDSMEIDSDDIFLDTKLRLKLKMAESCREQNNFSLTLQLLKETHGACKKSDDESLVCDWTHLYAGTHHRKTRVEIDGCTDDVYSESINSVLTTLDQLEKISDMECLLAQPGIGRRHYVLSGEGYQLLALGTHGRDSLTSLQGTRTGQKLMDCAGIRKLNKHELIEQFIKDGYKKMKGSISFDGAARPQTQKHAEYGPGEAYLATAKYCDTFIRLKEDEELKVGNGCLASFPETVVVCMLRAMRLDSMEARQLSPRLLQIVEIYPDTMATFIAKSKEVPCWMFILWISQMLAILDKPEAPAVHDALENIAKQYPQAVVYPFKLSEEGFQFGQTARDKKNKDFVENMKGHLTTDRVPLAAKFMVALENFGQMDQTFKDLFEDIYKQLGKKKRNKERIKEMYMELYWKILDYKAREKEEKKRLPSSPQKSQSSGRSHDSEVSQETEEDWESLFVSQSGLDIGSYARKFADKFKANFDKRFGPAGNKLVDMTQQEFQAVRKIFNGEFEQQVKHADLKPPTKLSEYSKWMSDFNPNHEGRLLEIPGQYTGLCKPQPEYHVKVAGFDQRVLVMSSLRKPKRITIRGNDEKDYHFLVKGGEDLRQDQRIEQLFYIMNQVLSNDPACRNRKLQLRTYQVIPMTPRVGLIEWMSNTMPLKDFFNKARTEQEETFMSPQSPQGPVRTQATWINKPSRNKDPPAVVYANVYKVYSHTETVKQFNIVENKVPWDLSRRAFHNLSTSPEAFHVLRSRCIQTHAMLSICQYIMGIGDRHLANFMVNMRTGEMVGIDFGHAFGSATQFLPVPELMPFRLTRQIRHLMLPLQAQGLLESTMIHVLRALRADSDLLLNTMDIFVKEPSLDWLQNADKQINQMPNEDKELYSQEAETRGWYPREKIQYVKRKLQGANSAYITRDELKLGHGKKSVFKDFEKVVLGLKDCVRARLPAKGLTVEEQVAALIDHATDPNILGRTYMGWESWL